jgi:hypothetical protein
MAMRAAPAATGTQSGMSSWRLGASAPWLWALASLLWFVASAYLTLPLVTAMPAQFFLQPLVWGGAVLGGALLLARVAFSRWLQVRWPALALALVGLVLAGLLEASLHAWAATRFGVFAWELVGPTAGLFAVIVGSAAAGFGVLVAPRRASLPPVLLAVGGALLSGLVVAVNMPGLADGIGAASVVPALLVAAGGAYALVVAFISVLVAVRRELSDDTLTSG